MEAHEQDWLDYAWGVVACGAQHAERCQATGGIGIEEGSTARFPGFLGPKFEPGRGVLCMAHVHRYLESDDAPRGRLAAIEAAILGWRQRGRSPESDATFLAESRPAYMASASEWPWWKKNYQPLLSKSRVHMDEVAFANFAKCRAATELESSLSVRLAKLCAEVYPPAALIRLLRPAAVLIASLQLDPGDVGDVLVVRWHGRTGRDDRGYRRTTWLEESARDVFRMRSG